MRRVVITGMGIVSPLGVGVGHVWRRLLNAESGISAIQSFDTSDLTSRIAGQVPVGDAAAGLFNAEDFMPLKEQRKVDPFILFAVAAADGAVADSGYLAETDEARERAGVMIGSGIGGLQGIHDGTLVLHEKGARRLSPFFIPSCLINLASGHVSIKYGFRGPNHSVVTACSTGAHAIGDAARLIMWGDADVMVAGGAEAAVCRLGIAGFCSARALSTSYNDTPEKASRPYDKGRDGFVMGEGAGVVVLEELEHAKRRGARIYAEVAGYGLSGDAYHITSPPEDGNGGYRAMKMALSRAGMNCSDIDYINAHGTSTIVGDMVELGAVRRLFSEDAGRVSMSSTKSAVGHLLGAAGAVEAIFCAKSIHEQVVPPTLNLEDPDEGTEGMDLVPLQPKERRVRAALSNSFGFGGTNASLVLKEYVG